MPVCNACDGKNEDGARFCSACGSRLPVASGSETRKIVTVLFCDLVGSTPLGEHLDPESLREVLDLYFQRMATVVERHGGVVETYIGDAIMAAFGIPEVHEDDALRAVRAAWEMRETLEGINVEVERYWGVRLANRTGVNTGEVVIGVPTVQERIATGDAVNVAARLEQAAPPGEILIGETTYRLSRSALQVEPLEPLSLKGKSAPVRAFRVKSLARFAASNAPRLEVPLVGRGHELDRLSATFEEVLDAGRSRLVTVTGPAGTGKTRLVAEFLGTLGQRAAVLRSRCLSYGQGITFWPVAEMIREAAGVTERETREEAGAKVRSLAGSGPDSAPIAERLAAVVGLSDASFPVEETFWAVRSLLEALAQIRPVVAVIDDLHWAEPTLLDLIEHVIDVGSHAPVLFVCPARPELFERRGDWGRRREHAVGIEVDPLASAESERLVDALLGSSVAEEIRTRIMAAAEGNPLFIQELVGMLVEDGLIQQEAGSWIPAGDLSATSIPPTIHGLLAARLDALLSSLRSVLERGSVVGRIFSSGAVRELSPEGPRERVDPDLAELARRQFIRSEAWTFAGEASYAFRHAMTREVAYAAMLKRVRADLHERFAEWLERVSGDRLAGYEEIVGYHLEQAHRYLGQLGPLDERARRLGTRAASRLAAAGRKAMSVGDMPAAVNLLSRAVSLLPGADPARPGLLTDLGEALMEAGDMAEADRRLLEAIEAASSVPGGANTAYPRMMRLRLQILTEPEGKVEEGVRMSERFIEEFRAGDEAHGVAAAYSVLAEVLGLAGRAGPVAEATAQGIGWARRAGDQRLEAELTRSSLSALVWGPTPVPEGIERCREVLAHPGTDRSVEGVALRYLGCLTAMDGDLDPARELMEQSRRVLAELGRQLAVAISWEFDGAVELLAGDPEAAERKLSEAYRTLERMGERGFLSTVAAQLGAASHLANRREDALRFSEISEQAAATDDALSQAMWRGLRAKLLAQARAPDAEDMIDGATRFADSTDFPNLRGDVLMDRAEVLLLTGDPAGATAAAHRAAGLYVAKGNRVAAQRARSVASAAASDPTLSARS